MGVSHYGDSCRVPSALRPRKHRGFLAVLVMVACAEAFSPSPLVLLGSDRRALSMKSLLLSRQHRNSGRMSMKEDAGSQGLLDTAMQVGV